MCDFYLLQYLTVPPIFAREDLWLEDTSAWKVYAKMARDMLDRLIEQLDPVFIQCLDMAVGGEIRHHGLMRHSYLLDHDREVAWSDWLGIRQQVGIDAVKDAADMFRDGSMRKGYGGEMWAVVADILHMRLIGILTPELFVDRVFNLQHNGGSIMNKVRWKKNARYLTCGPEGCIKIGNAHAGIEPDLGVLAFGASDPVRNLMRRMWPARNRLLRNQGKPMVMMPRWKVETRNDSRRSYARGFVQATFLLFDREGNAILDGRVPVPITTEPTVGYAWDSDVARAALADSEFSIRSTCGNTNSIPGIGRSPQEYAHCALNPNNTGDHIALHRDMYIEQAIVSAIWPNAMCAWKHFSSDENYRAPQVGDLVASGMYGNRIFKMPVKSRCSNKSADGDTCKLVKNHGHFPHCTLSEYPEASYWAQIVSMWTEGTPVKNDEINEIEPEVEEREKFSWYPLSGFTSTAEQTDWGVLKAGKYNVVVKLGPELFYDNNTIDPIIFKDILKEEVVNGANE